MRILTLFGALLLAANILAQKPDELEDLPLDRLTWGEFDNTSGQHPFKTWLHETNPETLAKACSWQLSLAQWRQDLFAPLDSAAHFDNCAFDDSLAFIADRLAAADAAVAKKDHGGAMFALGQALHAIQDFYSHSNYLELMAKAHPKDFTRVAPIDFWTAAGRKQLADLRAKKLVSGVVSYSRKATMRCAAGTVSHELIAKDSPSFSKHAQEVISGWGRRTYHVAAFDLAHQASERFLTYAFQRWQPLARECGRPIAFLTLVERRKGE
jgi:hypothetical protein